MKSRVSELENGKISKPHERTIRELCEALKIGNREVEQCMSPANADLDIKYIRWSHNSSFGVDTLTKSGSRSHHGVSFVQSQLEFRFSVEASLTSLVKEKITIPEVGIRVLSWRPIDEEITDLIPYAGLGDLKKFVCPVSKKEGFYRAVFSEKDKYLELSELETEIIQVAIVANDPGIYSFQLRASYIRGDKMNFLLSDIESGVWFIRKRSWPRSQFLVST